MAELNELTPQPLTLSIFRFAGRKYLLLRTTKNADGTPAELVLVEILSPDPMAPKVSRWQDVLPLLDSGEMVEEVVFW